MTNTLTLLLLSLGALSTSICALIVAARTSGRYLSKRLSALSMQAAQHADTLEALEATIRNLQVRLNMRAMRERKKELSENGDASESSLTHTGSQSAKGDSADDKWARETNLAIAKGHIRPWGR